VYHYFLKVSDAVLCVPFRKLSVCVLPSSCGAERRSWLRQCATTRSFRCDSEQGPGKFSGDLFLLSTFSSHGVNSACNRNEHEGISLGVKVRSPHRTGNSAVVVVPNVKVRMEVQHYIVPVFVTCGKAVLQRPSCKSDEESWCSAVGAQCFD
jgi:hypothetical protein